MNAHKRESNGLVLILVFLYSVSIRGLILSELKHHYCLSEMDLVACLQPGSAGVAVDFDARSLTHDAEAAIGPAFIPAVVEDAILAGLSVVIDMRVFA